MTIYDFFRGNNIIGSSPRQVSGSSGIDIPSRYINLTHAVITVSLRMKDSQFWIKCQSMGHISPKLHQII